MITGLDHIAIAVPDLKKAIERFSKDLGLHLSGTEEVVSAETSVAFFPFTQSRIELVYPLNNKGPIQKYLDKRGGGLHHLCFSTDDIESDVATLKKKGYQFITEHFYIGAHDRRVIWIHPESTDGVLIELAESK